MPAVTVAVVGGAPALRLAQELGKGNVEGDVGRHFHKRDDHVVNLVTPARYPERVQGVSQALLVGDHLLLVADRVDRDLGLLILAATLAGPAQGHVIALEGTSEAELQNVLQDTPMAQWPVLSGREAQPALVRQRLEDLPGTNRPGPARVVVEQAFPVRGVGTVVLGIVQQGTVKRHQELIIHPGAQKATVRSIQVHDENVDAASTGERVGLALRGIEADTLSRGNLLAEGDAATTLRAGEPIPLQVRVPRFYRAGLTAGRVLHLGIGLQLAPVETGESTRLGAGEEGVVEVVSTAPLATGANDRALLWDLDNTALRLAAGGRMAAPPGRGD